MPKRIVILNDGLGPNKGDQAILWAMLSTLKVSIPEGEITVLPYQWKLKDLWKHLRRLWQSDLLILGGGQALHDQTSVSFTLMVLSQVVFARILMKRVMGYAMGVGPLKTRIARRLTRGVVNQFELITVREPTSKIVLEELGITKPSIYITADASLLLEAAEPERLREIFRQEGLVHLPRPMVAIAPRRWFHYNHGLIPVRYKARFQGSLRGQEEFKKLEHIIARVADRLVTQQGAFILFVPMRRSYGQVDPGQDDDEVASEILSIMKFSESAGILSRDYNPEELKGILGQMDLVIGMRMHALMMGSSMGVPVIGIDISPKFEPFFRMITQDSFLIKLHDIEEMALMEKIEFALSRKEEIRKELLSKVERLRAQALMNNDFVLKLLN